MSSKQVLIQSGKNNLFGFILESGSKKSSNRAVLIVHPFAEEKKSSQKIIVDTARAISEKGYLVLIIDLFACGESEGQFVNVNLGVWKQNIIDSVQFLQDVYGIHEIELLGIRLGGFLVTQASQEIKRIKRLVLIEPIFQTNKYLHKALRQKLIKELHTNGVVKSNRDKLIQMVQEENSFIDFDGYKIGGALVQNMKEHDGSTNLPQNIDIAIFNITRKDRVSQYFLETLKKYPQAKLSYVKMPQFWNKIKQVDYKELLGQVAALY